ncbi:MAG: hypothetical protein AAGE52_29600, partial [Myxococcota bacterium]
RWITTAADAFGLTMSISPDPSVYEPPAQVLPSPAGPRRASLMEAVRGELTDLAAPVTVNRSQIITPSDTTRPRVQAGRRGHHLRSDRDRRDISHGARP